MAARKNLFIVFEGIDGSGCETQARLLSNYFENKKNQVSKLKYPDYSDQYGKLIRLYLTGRLQLTAERIFLTHLINQLKDREKIRESIRGGKFVVSDRYYTSNLAYNCSDMLPVDKALKVASVFKLPQPDLIFYLDTLPETAMKRKLREKGKLDVNERNLAKLGIVAGKYRNLARKNTFGQWFIINGNKPIDDVKQSILKILRHYI